MRDALADPNPGRALRTTIIRFGEQQLRAWVLLDALSAPQFSAQRRVHAESFAVLLNRARTHGAVRAEVTLADARTALMALGAFRTLPRPQATAAIGRLTTLLLKAVLT